MSRQRVASSSIRSHEMLVHRTSAHLRATTNGLIGFVLLAGVAGLAALVIWPSHAQTFRVDPAVSHIRDEGWDRYAPIVLVVAAVLSSLAFAYAIVRARRWRVERKINRVSAELSTTDHSMMDPATDHRAVATGLPLPRIQWVADARGATPKLRALTPTTNIIGLPRLEIAYLRLSNNQYRHVSFVKGAWREFGSVSMLRSAVSMTSKEAQRARRNGLESLFVTTRPQLEAELAAVGNAPSFGRHRVDAGPTRVRVRDRYGAYPMRSILCANATWRAAVDHLLDSADVVVLDLSGYTDRRAGTRYELQRVLDRVPAERLILLADPMSKDKILQAAIEDAWRRMSVDSPNAARPEVPLWIARVDRLVKTVDQERNTTTVELVTSRKETRLLMIALQERLRDARPINRQRTVLAPDSSPDTVDPWNAYGLAPSPASPSREGPAAVAITRPVSEPPIGDSRADETGVTSTVEGGRRRGVLVIALILLTLSIGCVIAATLSSDPHAVVARRDSQGGEVTAIQNALTQALQRQVHADGDYGTQTEQAVKDFQDQRGKAQTGEVDRALYNDLVGEREILLTPDQRRLMIAASLGLFAIAMLLFAVSGMRGASAK